jgi:hypothetical protein
MQNPADVELDQLREVVDLFNNITDRCFQDCVFNFRQKKISPDEKKVWSGLVFGFSLFEKDKTVCFGLC